jgi:imidazolonepropionase
MHRHKASPTALLLTHATVATMVGGYGVLANAAVAVDDGLIQWVGPMDAIPDTYAKCDPHDCDNRLVTPGLIDCHTHAVFAGNRADEFESRLHGASEQTILRAARRIAGLRKITVHVTHLAAHGIPPEYANRADAYIDKVAIPSMRAAHKEHLIDAVDAFCETIAFTPAQVERVFKAAQALNLPVKLHAEQPSNQGGAALAASHNALSADHLEYLSDAGIHGMKIAGTTAVILPGAFYTLREVQVPPIAALRAAHIPMAIATDCNPGSSPMTSPPLAMNMACTLFRMTPVEALQATTINAARAT